jgi:hypothetical protein
LGGGEWELGERWSVATIIDFGMEKVNNGKGTIENVKGKN